MPRHYRKMLAPINSVKHYVQIENAALADGARRSTELVDAVAAPATSTVQDVKQGAVIKAVYLEYWLKPNSTAGTEVKFQFAIEKVVSGGAPLTFTQLNNLQSHVNKKNIFYFSQGVLGDLTTASMPVFRSWLLLPKGKQRFGLGDKLVIALSATGATINNCGFSTYKEYI